MIRFGLENFRVFKEEQKFAFNPITVLIGPNNSGKSSVMKSLLLLKENITGDDLPLQLNFDSKRLSMNGLDDILDNQEKRITYTFETHDTIYLGKLQWSLHYGSHIYYQDYARLDEVEVKNESGTIIRFNYDKYKFYDIQVDLKFIFGTFLDMLQGLVKLNEELDLNDVADYEARKSEYIRRGQVFEQDPKIEKILCGNEYKLWKTFFHLYDLNPNNRYDINDITARSGVSLFKTDVVIDMKPIEYKIIRDFNENILTKYQDDGINRRERMQSELNIYLNKKDNLSELINEFFKFIEREFSELILSKLKIAGYSDVELALTEFGRFVFDRVPQVLINLNQSISGQLRRLGNVPLARVSKNRYFDIKDDSSYLAKRIQDYLFLEKKFPANSAFLEFSEKFYCDYWVKEFGIGNRLILDPSPHSRPYLDQIISAYIEGFDGQLINIANMGSGVSQIISLLFSPLEFIRDNDNPNYFDGSEYIIYLEEPESNLHPNWQSKLMDLIIDIHKEFEINFIIETHSEYMMRKLQYLTASKDSHLQPEDSVVYYLGAIGKKYSQNEKRVKRITIDQNGNLSDDFGSGFYDEAVNLKFDLLRLNKSQQN